MIGREAGKSYAYVLGVYLGDGCVTKYNGRMAFRLNTIDQDFALATMEALKDVTSVPTRIWKHEVKKSSKPNFALCCADPLLCEMLRKDTQYKTQLPSWLLCPPHGEALKAFITGLMDSEGYVAEKTHCKTGRAYYMGFKSCDTWIPGFIGLLQSAGLKIGKIQTEKPYKPHYKRPTRFHIKMQSWVNSGMRFNIKRKQQRVDKWADTVPYSERSRFPRKLTSETSTPEARNG